MLDPEQMFDLWAWAMADHMVELRTEHYAATGMFTTDEEILRWKFKEEFGDGLSGISTTAS